MNTTDYRYQLESRKLTGRRQQKTTCPQCGRRKCLVRYVDLRDHMHYVADSVGKCDHLHSCGYHYTPAHYFRDHPSDRPQSTAAPDAPLPAAPALPPFQPLPTDLVRRSHSPRSTLWQWLCRQLAPRLGITAERLQQVYADYLVGATRSADIIYWQIDRQGRVHGGHIMQYGADGHRAGYQGWVHARLIRQGLLPQDWQLYQCLYGEHLLARRPADTRVCLVESEKTALIMACLRPDCLWLATGGSGGLTPERAASLRGRRVTLFPDSGCYHKWLHQMQLTHGIHYNVYQGLEAYPPNTDLADLL